MSRVCQATAAICKRLQFWLAETVCSDLQFVCGSSVDISNRMQIEGSR